MPNYSIRINIRRFLLRAFTLILVILMIEGGTRLFLYFTRGSSTIGMAERQQYLLYKPFVMFGPDYDSKLSPSLYPKKAGTYRILLLGSSTAEGFKNEILQNAFHKKFPRYQFEVINCSQGGYNARQELILLALWGVDLKPNMIITLDGNNDLDHRLRTKKAGTFYLNDDYELALTQPFLSPVAHLLRSSQFANMITRFKARTEIGSAENYKDAVPFYIASQASITGLAKGISAIHIAVLQPFVAFKEPLSSDEAGFTHYKYREPVLKKLYGILHDGMVRLAKDSGMIYVDSRFIFNGSKNTIFSDDVHLAGDEGYRILADHIASSVTEKDIQKSF